MAAKENLAVARKFSDAMDSGEMAELDAVVADDIVWHQIGSPTIRGKAALQSGMPGAFAGATVTGKQHDILASDDHAIVLVDATATRDGKTFKYRTAEIYHIRNGQIVERWAFSDDTAAIAKFFA